MKKNNTNLHLEEKMKTLKVKPNKSFKNNLLNSLEKEYERWFEKTSFQKQNFNLINLEIMKNITKKVVAGVAVLGVALATLWAFNTSYASEKDSLFKFLDAWYELLAGEWVEFEDKETWTYMRMEAVSAEEELKINKMSDAEFDKYVIEKAKEWFMTVPIPVGEAKKLDKLSNEDFQKYIKENNLIDKFDSSDIEFIEGQNFVEKVSK